MSKAKNSVKKFLVTHHASVGVTKEDGGAQDPLYLTYYTMVDATTMERAMDQAVQYRGPSFRSRIANVKEIEKAPSLGVLSEMLMPSVVVRNKPHDE